MFKHHILIISLLAMSLACGSSRVKPKDKTPVRGGTSINTAVGVQYFDGKPARSANGRKIVFISGRDDGVYKAYRYNLDESAAQPIRLTKSDLGRETAVAVSPDDGKYVAVIAEKDGRSRIYVQGFAAPETLNEVVIDSFPAGGVIEAPIFSQGSEPFLAFELRWPNNNSWSSKVLVSVLGTNGKPEAAISLVGAQMPESEPSFSGVKPALLLFSSATGGAGAETTLYQRSVSRLADLATALPTVISPTLKAAMTRPLVSASLATWVQRAPTNPFRELAPSGDKPSDTKVRVQSELSYRNLADTNTQANFLTGPQYEIKHLTVSNDASILTTVGTEYLSCQGSEGFASTVVVRQGVKATPRRLVPFLKDNVWSLSPDPCSQTRGDPDLKVLEAWVASSAAGRLEMTLVSWFKTDFEIRHFTFTLAADGASISDVKVYEVSANAAPADPQP